MKTYSIDDVERAINVWRNRQAADGDHALAAQARVLARPYALMIVTRRSIMNEDELSSDEVNALREAAEMTSDQPRHGNDEK